MLPRRRLLLLAPILLAAGDAAHSQPAAKPDDGLAAKARAAIDRGAAALKKLQRADGSWGDWGPGSTALAGLALLEAGTPADDLMMTNAAHFVRFEMLQSI